MDHLSILHKGEREPEALLLESELLSPEEPVGMGMVLSSVSVGSVVLWVGSVVSSA